MPCNSVEERRDEDKNRGVLSGKRERRPVSQTLVYNTHLLPRTPPSPPTTTPSLAVFSFFLYLFLFVFVLLSEASILYSFVALLITLSFIQQLFPTIWPHSRPSSYITFEMEDTCNFPFYLCFFLLLTPALWFSFFDDVPRFPFTNLNHTIPTLYHTVPNHFIR